MLLLLQSHDGMPVTAQDAKEPAHGVLLSDTGDPWHVPNTLNRCACCVILRELHCRVGLSKAGRQKTNCSTLAVEQVPYTPCKVPCTALLKDKIVLCQASLSHVLICAEKIVKILGRATKMDALQSARNPSAIPKIRWSFRGAGS